VYTREWGGERERETSEEEEEEEGKRKLNFPNSL
jgi:hypothetical protein